MSTIDSASPYDLLATYSTAASISSNTGLESTEDTSTNDDFVQMMNDLLDETQDILDNGIAIDDTEGTEDENEDGDDSTGSGSTSGTDTNNSLYYRPDGVDPLDPDDGPSDELGFMDMLQLMILQFQNQTMDDTASTTDMMNQLTQMTTMQAMTSMEDSITAMTKTNEMLYISSLVGEEITVGYSDSEGNWKEETGIVTGSGYYGGYPVVFLDGKETFFYTSEILAVGRLPESSTEEDDSTGEVDPEEGTGEDDVVTNPEEVVTNPEEVVTNPDAASVNLYGYNYVDYSSLTEEELLEASKTAVG